MSIGSDLPARTEHILCSIVRAYIESGDPVASASISRQGLHNLSSASIRNVMADLASDGYLSQPHASAGRVPTEKAFDVFVQGLLPKRLQQDRIGQIRGELSEAGSVEDRSERCSHLLREMTEGVGITATIPAASQTLDRIELINLGERRVLMIVVTRDHLVRDHVVLLDEEVTQDQLNSIRNYVNIHFAGWILSEVQAELRRRFEQASAAYDDILKKLILLYEKGLLQFRLQPELHMDGTSNLVTFDFHITRDRLKDMFRALEEKKRILQLLDRFLEQPAGTVGVKVGLGDEDPSLGALSLIGICVDMPGGMSAKIAVLGPMRMNYERAVSAVLHVGRAFSSLPS